MKTIKFDPPEYRYEEPFLISTPEQYNNYIFGKEEMEYKPWEKQLLYIALACFVLALLVILSGCAIFDAPQPDPMWRCLTHRCISI